MISSQCVECKHYTGALECTAFDGMVIPQEILEGEFIHDKIHPDQTDDTILYEEAANTPN